MSVVAYEQVLSKVKVKIETTVMPKAVMGTDAFQDVFFFTPLWQKWPPWMSIALLLHMCVCACTNTHTGSQLGDMETFKCADSAPLSTILSHRQA